MKDQKGACGALCTCVRLTGKCCLRSGFLNSNTADIWGLDNSLLGAVWCTRTFSRISSALLPTSERPTKMPPGIAEHPVGSVGVGKLSQSRATAPERRGRGPDQTSGRGTLLRVQFSSASSSSLQKAHSISPGKKLVFFQCFGLPAQGCLDTGYKG